MSSPADHHEGSIDEASIAIREHLLESVENDWAEALLVAEFNGDGEVLVEGRYIRVSAPDDWQNIESNADVQLAFITLQSRLSLLAPVKWSRTTAKVRPQGSSVEFWFEYPLVALDEISENSITE